MTVVFELDWPCCCCCYGGGDTGGRRGSGGRTGLAAAGNSGRYWAEAPSPLADAHSTLLYR